MNLWERIKANKLVLGFLIFDIIAIVVLVSVNILNSFRSVTVNIDVVPIDAKVKINGRSYDNASTYKIFPRDKAKVEISYDGLEAKTLTLNLKKNSTNTIRTYLVAKDDDFSFYEQKDHAEDLARLQEIAKHYSQDKALSVFIKKANVLDKLPLSFEDYRDNYSVYLHFEVNRDSKSSGCDQRICLGITDYSIGATESEVKSETAALLKDKGFDPEDYKITYGYQDLSTRAGDS